MEKVALISGITGQDGAYLADFLLNQGYLVHGIVRRTSSPNVERLEHIAASCWEDSGRLQLHYGDLTDTSNTIRLVQEIQPQEIYNLAAQSHVQVSLETPEYTANADGIGTLRMLEAIRILGLADTTRFYQASTSELYGGTQPRPQDELTAFNPRSPYAIAKLFAYWTTVNYREVYGLHASNGILFNHESPLRGETFVTRKITRAVAAIAAGSSRTLKLGNLDARRDWGHAREYVRGMWLMLQQDYPDDYVLATGACTSVRQFAGWAFEEIGITLGWRGEGVNETGYDAQTGQCLVEIDPAHFRPTEVDLLQGDASKAKRKLGWSPQITVRELVQEMVAEDIRALSRQRSAELV